MMVSGAEDYLACLNPAIALGASFQQVYAGSTNGWSVAYVYLPGPIVGGLIAVFFHEFVYKKVRETIKETEEIDGILDKTEE